MFLITTNPQKNNQNTTSKSKSKRIILFKKLIPTTEPNENYYFLKKIKIYPKSMRRTELDLKT